MLILSCERLSASSCDMLISWEELFSSCNACNRSGVELLKISQGSICSCAVLLVGDDILQLLRKEMSGAAGLKGTIGLGGRGSSLIALESLNGVDSRMVAD